MCYSLALFIQLDPDGDCVTVASGLDMNRDSYNKIVSEFSSVRTQFHGRERDYLALLLQGLAKGTAVLDLGCGTGIPMAQEVIARGYSIIGVDQAEGLLMLAQKAFPVQLWIHASMEQYALGRELNESAAEVNSGRQDDDRLEAPEYHYGAAIIWDSLFHLERSQHEPILRSVIAKLPIGGRLMMTIGGSDHPAFTDSMFGQDFFYDSHAPEKTEAILIALGCRILVNEFMNKPTSGQNKGRSVFVVEKVID